MDPAIWWTTAAILGLLLMSAFFSGSETALTAVSRASLNRLASKGERGAETALKLTENSERLIGAVLLGNNLVNILAAALATHLFTRLLGEAGVIWATLLMTFLVLVFAEVTPKTYAITNPETAALRVARPISILVRLFAPVVDIIRLLARGALLVFGVRADPDARILGAHEQIRGAIDLYHSEGGVEKVARDRLLATLDLGAREVSEVMRHRRNIETIDADCEPREIVAFFLNSPHTRIPVWRENPENIVGVIHAKDLLREVDRLSRAAEPGRMALEDFDVMAVAMEPWFVPDTTSLDEQMREFLRRRSHFALVVDEYGDLQGLITLEDILEEIVGDIADEHDPEATALATRSDGSLEVDGEMTIRDLNRFGDWNLPDDEATTIAGLVIHEAQVIPEVGQIFSFHGFRFEVLARERHRITRMRVKPLDHQGG
ncbi:HlyC/CorC family transporter [Pikeienuella sp. HZG-20]|uniref:HlyC/CorC family transporter n=1 Tax=Paludibacillus litoralis TaxID=3133267 RepID=UPI0030EBF095